MCLSMMDSQSAISVVVDFVSAGREIFLVCPESMLDDVDRLAADLLAAGFVTQVIPVGDAADEQTLAPLLQSAVPAVVTVCRYTDSEEQQLGVVEIRETVHASSEVRHHWIDGTVEHRAVELRETITAAMDECNRDEQLSTFEPFDPEEVSNVVLLPAKAPWPEPPPPEPSAPARAVPTVARSRRALDLALGAVAAGILIALASVGFTPRASEPAPRATDSAFVAAPEHPTPEVADDPLPPAMPTDPVAPAAPESPESNTPPPSAPPEIESEPPAFSVPLAFPESEASQPPTPSPATEATEATDEPAPDDTALQAALAQEKISEVDGLLVTRELPGARTWFQAMNLCRARSFAKLSGWRVPSRGELLTLARSRSLPAQQLWSSNRSGRDATMATAVHGRRGTTESIPKGSTTEATVCVRSTATSADGEN